MQILSIYSYTRLTRMAVLIFVGSICKVANMSFSLQFCVMIQFMMVVLNTFAKPSMHIHAMGRDGRGRFTVAAQYLAIKTMNSTMLPEFNLNFHYYLVQTNSRTAIIKKWLEVEAAMQETDGSDSSDIHVPILLGLPTSQMSIVSNPFLSYFNWGQISSTASSVQLSDSETYPTFHRTMPSDDIQAQCIINLCQTFNWTKIGILYYADAYGIFMTNILLELGNNNGIKSYSVSFFVTSTDEDNDSIVTAAETLKELDVYIIVLIPHSWVVSQAFTVLDEYG